MYARVRMSSLVSALLVILAATHVMGQSGPVLTFFGPVDPNGCRWCCEFACQGEPAPAPEFDGEGRRIFSRSHGRFLLVVEGRTGTSRRRIGVEGSRMAGGGGSVVPITHSSGRPSLQVLASRNLGDGSVVECDVDPPLAGGVPGFDPPNFNVADPVIDARVTHALVDMACRFIFNGSGINACTLDDFGDFAFLDAATSTQFCFQIPGTASFPVGDTILAAQLRDTSGNPGPWQEIVIRVTEEGATPVPPPTATPTPSPVPASVVGRIRYYSADHAVPGAVVHGTAQQSVLTGNDGSYSFGSLPSADFAITPEMQGDLATGVSSLDAAHILQVILNQRTFDPLQQLACDVTGNGALSVLDAAHILQYVLGLRSRFSVATSCQSDWAFVPMPGPAANQRLIDPRMTTGTCQRGAIALEPAKGSSSGQDFLGVLFGDCTRNWQPGGGSGSAFLAFPIDAATVHLGRARHSRGGRVRVPIYIESKRPFQAMDLTLGYDATALRALSVRRLRSVRRAMVRFNTARAGRIAAVFASGRMIPAGRRPVAIVEFAVLGHVPAGEHVRILQATVDERPAHVSGRRTVSRVAGSRKRD